METDVWTSICGFAGRVGLAISRLTAPGGGCLSVCMSFQQHMALRRHTCYQGCIALSEHIPHQPWQEHTGGQWLHQSLQSPQTLLQPGAVALLAHDQLIGWLMQLLPLLEMCCGTTAIGSTPPQQTAAATGHSCANPCRGGRLPCVSHSHQTPMYTQGRRAAVFNTSG